MPATAPDPVVAQARAVLARHARTFALAGRLLPPDQLDDAAVLYAFCRHVDDLADDSPSALDGAHRLAGLLEMLAGTREPSPLVAALQALALRRGIDLELAAELVRGCASDLGDDVRVPDDDALVRYAYRVAGTVGLMICGVLGVTDPAAAPHAVDLGIAMQLTNICRDVREDALRDRVYLPATRLAIAGCAHGDELVEALAGRADARTTRRVEQAIERVVGGLLTLAESYYDSAAAGFRFIPARPRAAIVAAAWMYRAIGRQLRARGCTAWRGRTVVAPATRLAWLARAVLRAPLESLRPATAHRDDLHRALAGLPGTHAAITQGTP